MAEEELINQSTADAIDRAVGVGSRLLRYALPPGLTRETMTQQFEVNGPVVVFVKADGAQIHVQRKPGSLVKLQANLTVSAGLQVATRQDDAGVYIVILRKPVVGALSRCRVNLAMPPDCELVVDLKHSSLHLEDVNGRVAIPGAAPHTDNTNLAR